MSETKLDAAKVQQIKERFIAEYLQANADEFTARGTDGSTAVHEAVECWDWRVANNLVKFAS